MARKILYSPGYGGGWSSWEGRSELKRFMLEHPGLIAAVEAGTDLSTPIFVLETARAQIDILALSIEEYRDAELAFLKERAPAPIYEFAKECVEKFGEIPFLGGARDLRVKMVFGEVRIQEYDGYESVIERGDDAQEWI